MKGLKPSSYEAAGEISLGSDRIKPDFGRPAAGKAFPRFVPLSVGEQFNKLRRGGDVAVQQVLLVVSVHVSQFVLVVHHHPAGVAQSPAARVRKPVQAPHTRAIPDVEVG